MAKLDLGWLILFDAIYQHGSVSRAADQLGMSQASTSISLAKLRAYLGDPLFSRTPRGMRPTAYAIEIYPSVKSALSHLDGLRQSRAAFDPQASTRIYRLCMSDISSPIMIPRLINLVRETAPHIRIETELINLESQQKLEEGRLDLAVGFMPQLDSGFFERSLMREDFVCIASASHPRVRQRVTAQALRREDHVVVCTTGMGHSVVDKVLSRHKIKRNVVLTLPSFAGVEQVIAHTELLAIVPRTLGQALAERSEVACFEPPVQLPSYRVKLHWHERFHGDQGNAWLRGMIGSLFPDSAPIPMSVLSQRTADIKKRHKQP